MKSIEWWAQHGIISFCDAEAFVDCAKITLRENEGAERVNLTFLTRSE